MLNVIRKNIAIIPIFDSDYIKGFVKPISLNHKEEKKHITVMDGDNDRIIFETENEEEAFIFMRKRKKDGKKSKYKMTKREETIPIPIGDRCDQGIVKYIGPEVRDVKIGDYVFFSGYSGTLMDIEDEGMFIIMEERFVICKFEIDTKIEIPGLYFLDSYNRPLIATFEQAMNIIASTFTKLGKTVDVKSEKPRMEDYNVG